MTRDRDFLELDAIRAYVAADEDSSDFPLWTDQYNNIVQLLNIY